MRDTSGPAREGSSENKEGYIFITEERVERGEDHLLPHSWAEIKAYSIGSSFDPIWFNWDCHGAI